MIDYMTFKHPAACPSCNTDLNQPDSLLVIEHPYSPLIRSEHAGRVNTDGYITSKKNHEGGLYKSFSDDVELTCNNCKCDLDYGIQFNSMED